MGSYSPHKMVYGYKYTYTHTHTHIRARLAGSQIKHECVATTKWSIYIDTHTHTYMHTHIHIHA